MILAETPRLVLRTLERGDLPRFVELLDVWDVVRWLSVIPYPYTTKDAEQFFADMETAVAQGTPEFFAVTLKENHLLIGGIGLHAPRGKTSCAGEIEIGYWLGRDFWGRGFACEASQAVLAQGFARPTTRLVMATTSVDNVASQNILLKLGLRHKGTQPRDYTALRGENTVVRWELQREEWESCLEKCA